MPKVEIKIPIEEEKLAALNFCLQKENATAQQRVAQSLKELYETTVPQPLREYLESKTADKIKEHSKREPKNPRKRIPKEQLKSEVVSEKKTEKGELQNGERIES
jgi:hypothetical protein